MGKGSPETGGESRHEADVVHRDEAAPLLRRRDLAVPISISSVSRVLPTNLWYKGTEVDITATPTPQTARPRIIVANPEEQACTAAPAQRTPVPTMAAYRRPRESLRGREMKT